MYPWSSFQTNMLLVAANAEGKKCTFEDSITVRGGVVSAGPEWTIYRTNRCLKLLLDLMGMKGLLISIRRKPGWGLPQSLDRWILTAQGPNLTICFANLTITVVSDHIH